MESLLLRDAVRRHGVRVVLRHLYEATTPVAKGFRYLLLGLDVLSIAWIVTASFYGPVPWVLAVDALLGVLLLAEFGMRIAASGRPSFSRAKASPIETEKCSMRLASR